ncbi:MAG: SDR family oxidoreductase [Paracoccaceae bacterium]|jgi:dTDP-4-dehydrorhamnose reductase
MRLLIFGQLGKVATELARRIPNGISATFLGRAEADLSNPAACAAAIAAHPADAVINAAAWTAVDKAESEEPAATVVNGEAPAAMARDCALNRTPFLYSSTDYVFDGRGTTAFSIDHATAPQNAHGRSKLRSEIGVRDSGAPHLILRTSWVTQRMARIL